MFVKKMAAFFPLTLEYRKKTDYEPIPSSLDQNNY